VTAAAVLLDAGRRHAIRVEYYESKQNASARLSWASPSQPKEIIPRTQLFTGPAPEPGHGLKGFYRSMQQYLAYTQKDGNLYAITFEWPDTELALPIPAPRPGATVRLLGLDRDLPWRYASDTLYVDLSGISFREMPSQWAWTFRLEGY